MNKIDKPTRNDQITAEYFAFLDQHIADIVADRATKMLEINQIADALHISPKHLSSTIQLTQGQHPCYFYDKKILEEAQKLLVETEYSIAEIARKLTYDPSNFSKFFKKYIQLTPGQYRSQYKK